ncbi:MAG: hypothetical protein R3B06_26550 [Kofleriaceae bacterium]
MPRSLVRIAVAVAVVVGWCRGASAQDADAGRPPVVVAVDAAAVGLAVDAGAVPIDAEPAPAAAPSDARPIDAASDAAPTAAPLDARPIDAPPAPLAAGVIDAGVIDAALDGAAGPGPDAGPDDATNADAGAVAPLDGGDLTAPAPPSLSAEPPTAAPAVPPEPVEAVEPAAPATPKNASGVVIRLVLGLTAVFVLAYLGGHKRVLAVERRLGITGVIAAGFPFVALGVIIRQPAIGILTGDVLGRMQPILHFGLGWLGFIIGAQLDIRLLDRVPRGTGYLIVVEALGPFAAVAAACAGGAIALGLADWRAGDFWRDVIILGAAGAMTAPRRFRGFANRGWREGKSVDHLLSQLDEIVGVIGLLFVAAYFRPTAGSAWALPGTGWLFVTIGLGVAVGVLIFAMVRVPKSEGEFLAVVLGSVALGAGLAGYLYLSPIVICFIAGALVVNFPCDQRDAIFRILNHLERPIHLLFLIVAGASWDVLAGRAWVLVPVFVVARIIGKWAGITAARSTVGASLPAGYADNRVLVSPLSPLAIALVLSVQGGAGSHPATWLMTAVIGAAMLTEVAVQLTSAPSVPAAARATTVTSPLQAPTIDELDDDEPATGPVYRDELDDEDAP